MLIDFLQAHGAIAAGAAGVFGLLVGSFLNVVIYRLPVMLERDWQVQAREVLEQDWILLKRDWQSRARALIDRGQPSQAPDWQTEARALIEHVADEDRVQREPHAPFNLVVPRSRCPSCAHPIRAHENIPLLSYALQRGRCRACGWRIPARYPAVELLTGVLSVIVVAHFGVTLTAAAALGLTYALLALAFIDLDTQYLPDSITLPLMWAGLAVNLAGAGTFASLRDAVIGAMAGYLSLWSIYWLFKLITHKEGMGYGDFKLMAALGAWMGWSMLPATVLLSSLVGAVVGVSLIALRGHDRQVPIPFGPYIAAAGWGCLLWGEGLNRLYLQALI